MILRNKKGKELIIANDEEFIYKGRFRKRIIDNFLIYFLLINPILTNWRKSLIQILFLVLVITLFICSSYYYTNIVFNIDKYQFEIIKRNNTIKYKMSEIDKINLRENNNKIYTIGFEKDRKKIIFII